MSVASCLQKLQEVAERRSFDLPEGLAEPLARYIDLLALHNERSNLVGSSDPRRIADEMVLDALEMVPLMPVTGGTAVDIGSGAGLPGLPLAIWFPTWHFTLVEPRAKRIHFLSHARRTLQLANVTVREGRLEDLGDERFDAAFAKAVFEPAVWLERSREVLKPGGFTGLYLNGDAGEYAALLPAGSPVHAYALLDGRPRLTAVVSATY
ncbi:MAG: 16S rRNA (guanine(527)-N(7))-methyltransferase RsmG [Myxococcales bacterium]|nr:16S rRNA (guanine(527)-N(7))-methyltransferase RsmG [Myxococcales bacterium]